MPLTRAKERPFVDSNGGLHVNADDAQRAELGILLGEDAGPEFILALIKHRSEVVAILTTGPRSRPKARKAAGTTSPKRALRAGRARSAEEKAHVEDMTGQPFVATYSEAMREAGDAAMAITKPMRDASSVAAIAGQAGTA